MKVEGGVEYEAFKGDVYFDKSMHFYFYLFVKDKLVLHFRNELEFIEVEEIQLLNPNNELSFLYKWKKDED